LYGSVEEAMLLTSLDDLAHAIDAEEEVSVWIVLGEWLAAIFELESSANEE
jgi:hypothetical protein